MLKQHSQTVSDQYFNENLADIMDSTDHHADSSRFNSSFLSNASSNASASSSKAVLAALRALQDKIRRLEAERAQALDETSQLRHQLQSQEVEFEHAKQRDNMNSTKSLQDARSAYDRLLSEKTELEIRAARLEERNRDSRETAEELQSRIRSLEEEKYHGNQKLKDLESQHVHLEQQIEIAQRKEKDLAHTMVRESKRHDEDIETLNKRLLFLQDDLAAAVREKSECDARLVELDELVAQLLGLNEALVAKLSGKPMKRSIMSAGKLFSGASASSGASTGKKKKAGKKSSILIPRAAMVSTVATDAGKVEKYDSWRHQQTVHVDPADVEHLQMLHNMYRGMAKSITSHRKSRPSSSSSSSSFSSTPGGTGGSGAGGGGAPGSSKKVQTRISRSKQRSQSPGPLLSSSFASTGSNSGRVDVRIPSASLDRSSSYLSGDESEFDSSAPLYHQSQSSSPPRGRKLSSSAGPNISGSTHHGRDFQGFASANESQSQSQGGGVGSGGLNQRDLQGVISSLEEEFDALNVHYRRLLSTVQQDEPSAEPKHAEELVQVIQQLQKKGDQLRALKSPGRGTRSGV